jgi:hypothetical protein
LYKCENNTIRILITEEDEGIKDYVTQYAYCFEEYITYTLTTPAEGFNACDWLTGELFVTSRGTEYGAEYRVSSKITKTVNYSWDPIN